MKILFSFSLFLLFQKPIFSQGNGILPPTLFGPPMRGPLRGEINYAGDSGNNETLSYETLGTEFLYKSKESPYFFSGNYRQGQLGVDQVTLEDGVTVGGTLIDQNLSMGYTREQSGGNSWSFIGGIGSTSDDPFARGRDTTIRLSAVNVRKQSQSSAWIFGAFYNNNLNVGIPALPIIAYSTRPSSWLRLVVGIPFLNMTVGDRKGTSLFLLATPGGARGVLRQSIMGPFAVSAGYRWDVEGFQHARRNLDEEQFFIEKQTYFFGLEAPVAKGMMARLNFGRRYNSRYFQAEGVFDDADQKFALPDSDFIDLSLMFFL